MNFAAFVFDESYWFSKDYIYSIKLNIFTFFAL